MMYRVGNPSRIVLVSGHLFANLVRPTCLMPPAWRHLKAHRQGGCEQFTQSVCTGARDVILQSTLRVGLCCYAKNLPSYSTTRWGCLNGARAPHINMGHTGGYSNYTPRYVPKPLSLRAVLQNEMAKMVIERVPSIEMVRFVNSGTEACLSVLRLMRAYTGREKVRVPWGC